MIKGVFRRGRVKEIVRKFKLSGLRLVVSGRVDVYGGVFYFFVELCFNICFVFR